MESRYQVLLAKLAKAEQRLADSSEKARPRLEGLVEQVRAEIAELEEKRAQQELVSLRGSVQEQGGKLANLTERLASSREEALELADELAELQAQLDEANQRADRFESELTQARREAAEAVSLRKNQEVNKRELSAARQQFTGSLRQLSGLQSQLSKSLEQQAADKEKLEKLGGELTELRARVRSQGLSLEYAQADLQTARKQAQEAQEGVKRREEALRALNLEVKRLETAAGEASEQSSAKLGQISELRAGRTSLEKENKALVESLARKESELARQRQKMIQTEEKLRRAQSRPQPKLENAQLEQFQQVASLEKQLAAAEAERARSAQLLAELQKEAERWRQEREELTGALRRHEKASQRKRLSEALQRKSQD